MEGAGFHPPLDSGSVCVLLCYGMPGNTPWRVSSAAGVRCSCLQRVKVNTTHATCCLFVHAMPC